MVIRILNGKKNKLNVVYKVVAILVIIATSVALLVLFFASSTAIKIVESSIKSSKITENIKVALITDLHSCDYGDNQVEGLLRKALEPHEYLISLK